MFKNTYQNGLLSIFYSCGSNPLGIWDMEVKNGHIKRLTDSEVNSLVLEIVGTNVATTFITCPKKNQNLGIKLPFLVMIVKNLKRYFSFEITILDDKGMRRRFRISNFQSTTKIKPFCTSMPIGLAGGWNQIQFNLADFTRRAYGSQFIETQRVQIHANARLRRIYFSERLYAEEELPQEYKLFLPLERKKEKKAEKKEEPAPAPAPIAAPPPVEPEPTAEELKEEVVKKSEVQLAQPIEGGEAAEAPTEPPAEEEVVEEAPPPSEVLEGEVPLEGAEATEVAGEAPADTETPETLADEAPAEEPPAEEAPVAE